MFTKLLKLSILICISLIVIFAIGFTSGDKDEKYAGDNVSNMNHKKATFGAGCFWGVEAIFQELEGVVETSVGFMGGTTDNPTYEDVCYKETNHAEVVQITYDPNVLSYIDLLSVFFSTHNPTTLNRQGPDIGSQYRSAIFYHDDEQKADAIYALEQIDEAKYFDRAVVTEVTKAMGYYIAEDYHQQYYQKKGVTPHCGIGTVNVKLKEME